MKVIDLLNKIANGEKIKKFEYYNGIYEFNEEDKRYYYYDMWFDFNIDILNDEVEIIEEKPKHIEEIDIGKMSQTKKWKRDKNAWKKINELTKAVNYLLDKEEKEC